ncbi:unnamed protein product [Amoebophrya sp. A25]|nr:unnamed protein product [Amoebophrya sp. A25]|eukprot:GSA25T00021067001.1
MGVLLKLLPDAEEILQDAMSTTAPALPGAQATVQGGDTCSPSFSRVGLRRPSVVQMSSVNPYAAARTRRVSFLRLGNESANSPGTRFFSEALAPGRSAAAASGNRQNVIADRVCLASRLRGTAFGARAPQVGVAQTPRASSRRLPSDYFSTKSPPAASSSRPPQHPSAKGVSSDHKVTNKVSLSDSERAEDKCIAALERAGKLLKAPTKLTQNALGSLGIDGCEFPVPLFKVAASLRANPKQVTRAESKVQLLRFGAANLFAQIDDKVSAEEKHERHGCQKVFFSEGFNNKRQKQIAAALLKQVEIRGGCEVSPAVEHCAGGGDCKERITFINAPDAVQAATAAFQRSTWPSFRVLHSIGRSDQVGEFAEWGMGDLTTNIQKYDKDKSGSICPDEAGDAVLEGGLSAAVGSLSEVFGSASGGMTKKMVRMFSEVLSKWKAEGDQDLEWFFRRENGMNAEKRSSASGSNGFVEEGASPCISLKRLGSPSSESDPQKPTATAESAAPPPPGHGDPNLEREQGLDQHQYEEAAAQQEHDNHEIPEDEAATGGSEEAGGYAASVKQDVEAGDHELQSNENKLAAAAAGDDDVGKAGEGTEAARQNSETVDPHDVISQQIAGLRLRKYLRRLLKQVLSDGTSMIKSVVDKEITSTKMDTQFDSKETLFRRHHRDQPLPRPMGDGDPAVAEFGVHDLDDDGDDFDTESFEEPK